MLHLSGLRVKYGCKVFTQFLLNQQRLSSKTVTQTNPKDSSQCLYRPVPAWGQMCRSSFDLKNVTVCLGLPDHTDEITSFLMKNYWPREPITTGLYMDFNSPYLMDLTRHYVEKGDPYIAIENTPCGPKLVGVCIAEKITPFKVHDLVSQGDLSRYCLEGIRLLFLADVLRKADTFKTYNVQTIYHVEVLATDPTIAGQGVGTLLLETALSSATIGEFPLFQVLATSSHVAKICRRLKMTQKLSTKYTIYTDIKENRLFFPRHPHTEIAVYARLLGGKPPDSKSEPKLFKTYSELLSRYKKYYKIKK